METEQEKVAALQRIFTSPSMKKQIIVEILRDNGGSFDKTFDILLQMNQEEEEESVVNNQRKAEKKLTDAEKKTRIRELQTMFGGDMTQSLIQDVVATHPDSLESAVEELLNITSEEVAYNRKPVGLEEERKRQEDELRHYEEWKRTHEKAQEELRRREEEERKLLADKARKEESERAAERERLIKLQQERRQQVEQEKIKKMEEKLKLELEKLQQAEALRIKKQEEERAKKEAERLVAEHERLVAEHERLAAEQARILEEQAKKLVLQKIQAEAAEREEQRREAEKERMLAEQREVKLRLEQEKARQEEERLRLELAKLEAEEEERLRKIREEVELRLRRVREEGEERLKKIKEEEERERVELAKKEADAIALARAKNLREEEEMRRRVEERLLEEKRLLESVKEEEKVVKEEVKEEEKPRIEDESFQTSFAPVSPSAPRHTAVLSINSQGDEINGTWTLEEAMPSPSDWVGLFPAHQPSNYKYTQSVYVNSSSPLVSSGNFTFKAVKPGRYVVKFFRGKSYVPVAASSRVLVGPKVVDFQASVVGDSIEVRYTLEPPSAYPTYDWIGIYEKDRRNKRYMVSSYGNKEGLVTLRAPRTPGLYEARLFVNTSQYNEQEITSFVVADNDNISIVEPPNSSSVDPSSPLVLSPGTPVTVSYVTRTVEPSTSDWIGVYSIDQGNNKAYLESRYTPGTTTGNVTFTTPTSAGVYEFRLFVYSVGKYVVFRRSRSFEVVLEK
eukprot:TRINITY_DN2494_c0_g1_i1.p1 TRINITY_DN2494_c0_g1~~TRINITY_DN2494_c0_g1_i1.p1  ORF type:complete len:737 (+),score=218.80 TRINITY_DN2494_c0_g1_i1:239-2449(+)